MSTRRGLYREWILLSSDTPSEARQASDGLGLSIQTDGGTGTEDFIQPPAGYYCPIGCFEVSLALDY
ncbi:hypothetical protein RHS03_01594, partial [Rhizoctonia solani]